MRSDVGLVSSVRPVPTTTGTTERWGPVATAIAVALAYYAGARLGMGLRFPNSTPSVLWPPNALLTAALLLTPTKRWWLVLLAALPAHLAVELGSGWSSSLVAGLFVTNCLEALLAAGGVLWLTGRPGRFDTLVRTLSFLASAVVVAPFLSSFADAGIVRSLHGELYWEVWRTRFFSNFLAALTIVPAVVLWVRDGGRWLRSTPLRRKAEAAMLALCLVAGDWLAFASTATHLPGETGPIHDPLVLTLPLLLWAAVRFGPAGLSLSLLFTTVVAISGGMSGRGPFAPLPPESGVLALQLFLGTAGIPLLMLASAAQERRHAMQALAERLSFEQLLVEMSRAFGELPSPRISAALAAWLERLGTFLHADRGILSWRAADGQPYAIAHQWHRQGLEPLATFPEAELPWAFARLLQDELVVKEGLEQLPAAAARDREWLRGQGLEAAFLVPLRAGTVRGCLAFLRRQDGPWTPDAVLRGRLIGEVFAGAFTRRETEAARQGAEELERGILAALPSQVAILDRRGRVLTANEAWARFDFVASAGPLVPAGVGADYFELCRQAVANGAAQVADCAAGIRSVLDACQASYGTEYRQRDAAGDRWFSISVTPIDRVEGGAIVTQTDVTRLKQSEFELQTSRQELAHFNRVATMGELTASLAHEINQPLTGILLKAQIARRLLDRDPPDAPALSPLLEDLVQDARRASAVIRRSRDFLSKHAAQEDLLDVNREVRAVARLVEADASRRRVGLKLELAPGELYVVGDQIQLQQVVLNLLVNALEASEGLAEAAVSASSRVASGSVEVSVTDSGCGLAPEVAPLLFEPFFTTKQGGMGMGLSICRTIVQAHGGSIKAINNATRGATVSFSLPLAPAAAVPSASLRSL